MEAEKKKIGNEKENVENKREKGVEENCDNDSNIVDKEEEEEKKEKKNEKKKNYNRKGKE